MSYTLSEAWSGVDWTDLMAAQGAIGTDFYDRSSRTIVGTMLGTEYRPVIKIGPKGALGSHTIRPIHSAPNLGLSIDSGGSVWFCWFLVVDGTKKGKAIKTRTSFCYIVAVVTRLSKSLWWIQHLDFRHILYQQKQVLCAIRYRETIEKWAMTDPFIDSFLVFSFFPHI